ncbi:MAG: hypothetical protein U1F11_05275 [Steroidobacteraceae bacterium]
MALTCTVGSYKVSLLNDRSKSVEWEQFIVTTNPDGSHTAQSMTRFPGGSIVRHVTQTVDAQFRPMDGVLRLFVGPEYQGTLVRRVVGDNVTSLLLAPDGSPIQEATLPGGQDLVLGYHPTVVEGWKFTHCDRSRKGTQHVRILTTSATWNGGQMSHGKEVTLAIEYIGEEKITVPAGTFVCDHYLWHTGAIDADIEVWTTGQDRICARVIGHAKGVIYELERCSSQRFGDSAEIPF